MRSTLDMVPLGGNLSKGILKEPSVGSLLQSSAELPCCASAILSKDGRRVLRRNSSACGPSSLMF